MLELIQNYNKFSNEDRDQIIWMVKASELTIRDKINFYASTLKIENYESAMTSAADFLLVSKMIPRNTENERCEFYALRKKLVNPITPERNALIDKIASQ